MSPEQVRRHPVDFRADLFAFGVVVYEMTTGSNPFEAGTATATAARILEGDPPPLSEPPSTGLDALDRIVAICLRKRAEDRYGSTQELVADLERLQAGLSELRDQGSGRQAAGPAAIDPRRSSAQWWWEFHQVAVSTVYALMVYPAWRARVWLDAPWGMLFFFAVLAAAATSISVRLHLRFTARVYPMELPLQLARAQPWTRWTDAVFSGALLLGGVGLGNAHPEVAALLVTVAIAAAVASFTIETATTRAAFGETPQPR
jgi:hypothetical protein